MEGENRAVAEESSLANSRRMLQAANQRGCRVALIGPPPIADSQQNRRTRQLSVEMARVAMNEGVPFLAVFDDLIGDPVWMAEVAADDGAHSGAEGYARFAALVDGWDRWWFKE